MWLFFRMEDQVEADFALTKTSVGGEYTSNRLQRNIETGKKKPDTRCTRRTTWRQRQQHARSTKHSCHWPPLWPSAANKLRPRDDGTTVHASHRLLHQKEQTWTKPRFASRTARAPTLSPGLKGIAPPSGRAVHSRTQINGAQAAKGEARGANPWPRVLPSAVA